MNRESVNSNADSHRRALNLFREEHLRNLRSLYLRGKWWPGLLRGFSICLSLVTITFADVSTGEFGKSYSTLRPEQKRLVDDFVSRYNTVSQGRLSAEQAYDGARLSIRTTFDAVT